jgi:hypothetical protein
VYKKTAKQPLPSLKLYNPPSAAGGSGEPLQLHVDTLCFCCDTAAADVLAFPASGNSCVVCQLRADSIL